MFSESVKIQQICGQLGVEDSRQQYQTLCDILAHQISTAKGFKTYVNCISSRLISNIVYKLTGIKLTSSNFSVYKNNGYDIPVDIAKRLKIKIIHGLYCNIELNDAGILAFTPATNAPSRALNVILEHEGESVRDILYSQWHANGKFKVGDKRNWPSPCLLKKLNMYNTISINIPLSHDSPVRLGRLLRFLRKKFESIQPGLVEQSTIDSAIDEFCLSDIAQQKANSRWLPVLRVMRNIDYVDKLTSELRQSPYFYVKSAGSKIAKIGSADRTNSRVKNDDFAVIFALNSRPESDDARRIESIVRQKLMDFHVAPIDGKIDHYEMTLEDLAPLVLNIINNATSLHPLVYKITATRLTETDERI